MTKIIVKAYALNLLFSTSVWAVAWGLSFGDTACWAIVFIASWALWELQVPTMYLEFRTLRD